MSSVATRSPKIPRGCDVRAFSDLLTMMITIIFGLAAKKRLDSIEQAITAHVMIAPLTLLKPHYTAQSARPASTAQERRTTS